MVTEFLHHGLIDHAGRNVVVVAKNHKRVPARVLQLGPGDFCRLAFETLDKQSDYEILYGGAAPAPDTAPKWNHRDGLLLETRQFRQCDLRRIESVREAFESAEPIGSDYVQQVHHACNPFSLEPAPFLSRYTGQLHISKPGEYRFWTASQDCSFLLIDDKVVVKAPGRHPPLRRARPGTGGSVQLSAGPHKFEYYHAATGVDAVMAAAWAVLPQEDKPQPVVIPADVFRGDSTGRVVPGTLTTRAKKLVPDFEYTLVGDVPLPDNPTALIGVSFKNTSPKSLTVKSKVRWDFGDGQTSDQLSPAHVYLHPGLYRVSLSVKRGSRAVETTNRIQIDRPSRTWKSQEKVHKLEDYLPMLDTYNPATLDAVAIRQLVLAYQWKRQAVLDAKRDENKSTSEEEASEKEAENTKARPRRKTKSEEKRLAAKAQQAADAIQTEANRYLIAAVKAGETPFVRKAAARGDEDLFKLAKLVGPMARVTLGDSLAAFGIWQGAAEKITTARLQAECRLRAADIAVSDLLDGARAKPLLDAATAAFGKEGKGAAASRLHRIRGDLHALAGEGEAARQAYDEARRLLDTRRSHRERTAWHGAHSRSTEQFLKSNQWDRALAEILLWQQEFPAEKADGYLNLLYARYWSGRQKHEQAISLAEQLIAVNAASPHADQLLLLAAECEIELGRTDRAAATLRSLLKDYPGSPLVPTAKQKLDSLK